MTETTLLRQRVEPEQVEQLREWLTGVEDREAAALETLDDESVYTETAFLEETDGATYLVTYMEAEDLQRVQETFEESTHDIDREYKEVMRECLVDGEPVGEFEPLYHLANPER